MSSAVYILQINDYGRSFKGVYESLEAAYAALDQYIDSGGTIQFGMVERGQRSKLGHGNRALENDEYTIQGPYILGKMLED